MNFILIWLLVKINQEKLKEDSKKAGGFQEVDSYLGFSQFILEFLDLKSGLSANILEVRFDLAFFGIECGEFIAGDSEFFFSLLEFFLKL